MAPKKRSGPVTGGRGTPARAKVKAPKRKRTADPTRDAPFRVDVASDGDIASLRQDLSEDEIKEQADLERSKSG